MKKNVLVIVSLLIAILSIFYVYVKTTEAERNLWTAESHFKELPRLHKEAERQTELAARAAAKARAAQVEAERIAQELAKCQSK